MRKTLSILIVLLASASAFAQQTDYIPKIAGVMRMRYEQEISGGLSRFQLRNARVAVSGNIANQIDYFLQTDLCQAGKMVFLDGWARIAVTDNIKIKAGQFRVPFGIDPTRGPATYFFSNRSFIGRDIANLRALGVSFAYLLPRTPLTLEVGVFDPHAISIQSEWSHQKVFASKATFSLGDFRLASGFESICPDSIRINLVNAAITYSCGPLTAEGEYVYKHYTNDAFKSCHAYNFFVNFLTPAKLGIFNEWSIQARWDGSTTHSGGMRDENGSLTESHHARNRVTVGSTLTYRLGRVRCDLRLNFEKYFYHHGTTPPVGKDDKIVAEMIIVF